MDEIHHYDALLEIYKKQEALLSEKQQQLQEILKKYENIMQNLMGVRSQWENEVSKLSQRRLNFNKNLQQILDTCEETDLSWKKIKDKQTDIEESQNKVANVSNHHLNIVKGVEEDLKQLDSELQTQNLSNKTVDFKSKTQLGKELLETLIRDFDLVSRQDQKLPDYQLAKMQEHYKTKLFPKNIEEINSEIKRINNNLKTIDKKTKELEACM